MSLLLAVGFVLLAGGSLLTAREMQLRIAQLDPATLLINQEVQAYVSVTGGGRPLTNLGRENFRIFESATGPEGQFRPADITAFRRASGYEEGINFLLLVDNSGSMYLTPGGARAANKERQRIASVRRVITKFLERMTNPDDTVSLAMFNTFYSPLTETGGSRKAVRTALGKIGEPDKQSQHTEIYAGIVRAVDDFKSVRGRKAIIVLSDGRNEYYSDLENAKHPEYGDRRYLPAEAIRACQKAGISVFAINFGTGFMKDKHLGRIARESGGLSFEAGNEKSLSKMYERIAHLIGSEYRIAFRANMLPADIKHVRVVVHDRQEAALGGVQKQKAAVMPYFSSTVLGLPRQLPPWFPLMFLLPLLLLWLLSRLKMEKQTAEPGLEILDGGKTRAWNRGQAGKTMPLASRGKTIIGFADEAENADDAASSSSGDNAGVTIVFDPRRQAYVLAADEEVTVNNRPVTTRTLGSGDVITIRGRTMVFDSGNDTVSRGKER